MELKLFAISQKTPTQSNSMVGDTTTLCLLFRMFPCEFGIKITLLAIILISRSYNDVNY